MRLRRPNVAKLESRQNVDGLVRALGDEDPEIRVQAARALGELADRRAVEPLIAALEDRDTEAAAARALSRIGAPAVEPLVRVMREKGKGTRAGDSLRGITDPLAVEPLVVALGDSDPSIRADAACALGKIGDPSAVEPLLGALQDPHRLVADWSAEALGRIGDARAVPPLVVAEGGRRPRAAADALDALGWAPADDSQRVVHLIAKGQFEDAAQLGKTAVEPLVAALGLSELSDRERGSSLEYSEHAGRERAARALGGLGDVRAVEPLIGLLHEASRLDTPSLGDAAVAALGDIGEPAVEPLIATLGERVWSVRVRAMRALGRIGDPRAIDPLTAILTDDEDRMTRDDAAAALRQIEAAARPADVVISRRGVRGANLGAYLAVDVGDLTHTMPQRTYEIARGWVERDTPGPLQEDEVHEVTHFAGEQAPSTLERFGYELVWQDGGYDILKKASGEEPT